MAYFVGGESMLIRGGVRIHCRFQTYTLYRWHDVPANAIRIADLFHSSVLNECRNDHFTINDLRLVVEASSTGLLTDFTDEVIDSALKVLKSGAWVLTKEVAANPSPYLLPMLDRGDWQIRSVLGCRLRQGWLYWQRTSGIQVQGPLARRALVSATDGISVYVFGGCGHGVARARQVAGRRSRLGGSQDLVKTSIWHEYAGKVGVFNTRWLGSRICRMHRPDFGH